MLKSCFLKVPSLYKSILKYVYFSFWRRVEFEDWTWKTVYMFSKASSDKECDAEGNLKI